MRIIVFAVIAAAITTAAAGGQQCPQTSTTGPNTASEVRKFEGALVYDNAIRKWFELKLDAPQCEQASIELVRLTLDDWDL